MILLHDGNFRISKYYDFVTLEIRLNLAIFIVRTTPVDPKLAYQHVLLKLITVPTQNLHSIQFRWNLVFYGSS